MRFLDVAKVYAQSGAGGNGCPERRADKRSEGVARATRKRCDAVS
jgi:GTPase involved in cell partitioning and DNA repair